MTLPTGAHVEIVDPKGGAGYPLVPSKVLINGVDVGFVAVDGLKLEVGDKNNVTTVTITLLPSRVTIRGADQATVDEPKFQRWGQINPVKDQESQ